MNWKFMQQAKLSSQEEKILKMRVDCDAEKKISVEEVEVPLGQLGYGFDTTDGHISAVDTTFYVEGVLGAPRGDSAVKYLIFNDKNDTEFGGLGWLRIDPVKSASNENRNYTTSAFIDRTPGYGLAENSWESMVPVHEALHVMGAAINYQVAPYGWVSAPYATTGFHCVDGIDILCYRDGGTSPQGSYSESRCPQSAGYSSAEGVAMDCGFDTYFDAMTEPGEWLSQWWNIGGAENPFLVEPAKIPPSTGPATEISAISATVAGTINPGDLATAYRFEYGKTTAYGSSAPSPAASAGSGGSPVAVSQQLTGLEPKTTYHYRLVSINAQGIVYGQDKVFTTLESIEWRPRNSNSAGNPDLSFSFGSAGHWELVGDWNNDGVDTPATYDPSTGTWRLRNSNGSGPADITVQFGGGPWTTPVVGDWNNDGIDTVGVYDPASGNWKLRNVNGLGADISISYGGGPWTKAVVGDWNNDGTDTIGLYDPSTAKWALRNSNSAGNPDVSFAYGGSPWTHALAGDWDGNGTDTIGVYNRNNGNWALRNLNGAGNPDLSFAYGSSPWTNAVVGDWDGNGTDTVGVTSD
jgi:hypothetical protein